MHLEYSPVSDAVSVAVSHHTCQRRARPALAAANAAVDLPRPPMPVSTQDAGGYVTDTSSKQFDAS